MIDAIIFDFGDIFINLDKPATISGLQKLGMTEWNTELDQLNLSFETGSISPEDFIGGFKKQLPNASEEEILKAWNAILADFPFYRLEFLQELAKKYRLFLLSNTDSIHINTFEQKSGVSFYKDFYNCFEKVYFSFDIGMRKPDPKIYEFVLEENNLIAENTLFVDDKKENTDSAAALGIKVWNLQVGKEDVIDLYKKKYTLRILLLEINDTYQTIATASEEILFKEKGSKFFGYAFPIDHEDEVKPIIEDLKKLHPHAVHYCYAYQLGVGNKISYRANDDGEPSNTAGAPIYGQIQSFGLTNVLVVVVRIFGGVKLGVGGLISAYRTTAQLTLDVCEIVEKTIDVEYLISFDYKNMNKVMRVIKEKKLEITSQEMEMDEISGLPIGKITIKTRKKMPKQCSAFLI